MKSLLTGRIMQWNSTVCTCSGHMEVDTEKHRFHVHPCHYDHFVWCWRVTEQALTVRLRQIPVVKNKDIKEISKLLLWKPSHVFFRPTIKYANNGLKAYQAYQDWDGRGIGVGPKRSLPAFECEEPELLADLVQAKKCREFQIDEWVDTYEKFDIYPIWPEEYLTSPGMTNDLFIKLFRKKPPRTNLIEAIENILFPQFKYPDYPMTGVRLCRVADAPKVWVKLKYNQKKN